MARFQQELYHFAQVFESEHLLDTYVFCLSEHNPQDHDGLLSMWRGYGANGNGAAIVFDTAKMTAQKASSPLIISKVEYGSADARINFLKTLFAKFAALLNAANLPDDKTYIAASMLFDRIKQFALFTKHIGFIEENEWRVVYMAERDADKVLKSMFSHSVGPRGIEPKMKFKVKPIQEFSSGDLSLEKLIERIILGPSVASPIAKAAVSRMLDAHNKSALKNRVIASSIPFRAIG